MSKFSETFKELREQIDAKGTPDEQDAQLEHLDEYVPTAHHTVDGLRGFVHNLVEDMRSNDDAEAEGAGETSPAPKPDAVADGV